MSEAMGLISDSHPESLDHIEKMIDADMPAEFVNRYEDWKFRIATYPYFILIRFDDNEYVSICVRTKTEIPEVVKQLLPKIRQKCDSIYWLHLTHDNEITDEFMRCITEGSDLPPTIH